MLNLQFKCRVLSSHLPCAGLAGCERQHFLAVPRDSEVTEGEAAVLECRVGGQVGQVQWTKDGLTLGEWKDEDVT